MTLDAHSSSEELIGRLERARFSRWHLGPRLIVGSATFFDAFDALSLAFVLPVLVRDWSLSSTQVGWLISIGYLGQFAGGLFFGSLAEKQGRVRAVAAATAVMSVMSIACATSWSFSSLLALRLVQGLGVGGEMPVAAVYINELSKAQGRGRFFLLYELIFPIGLMATGQIGALVVPTLGWQIMFLIGGIPGLVVTALLLRLPESPRWLISKNRLPEAEAIIQDIEASSENSQDPTPNPRLPTANSTLPAPNAQRTQWAELLSHVYRRRTIVVWTLWACAYFVTNGLNNWMPTMYNSVYRLSLSDSLRAGTLTNIAQVVILLFCAFAIDRIGRQRWTTVGFTAGAVLLATLGLFASQSVGAVITIVTLSYGLVGSVNAVLYLYTPEIYPTRMRALGTGSATCWLRLSSAAAPLLVGYLVQESGPGAVFMMFAAAGAIGMVAGTMMLETRNRRLEDIAP